MPGSRISALVTRAASLMGTQGRAFLGIAGPPGSGKSTLAAALSEAMIEGGLVTAESIAIIPMDGFHLADSELIRLGIRDRKGAPETFDVAGYVSLLARLHTDLGSTVYAPAFERTIEQAIAGSIAIAPPVRLVITEGNYLLHDADGWAEVAQHLDEVWFCNPDDQLRRDRLVRRHVEFGKSPEEARAWVRDVDEPNAELVRRNRDRADLVADESVWAWLD